MSAPAASAPLCADFCDPVVHHAGWSSITHRSGSHLVEPFGVPVRGPAGPRLPPMAAAGRLRVRDGVWDGGDGPARGRGGLRHRPGPRPGVRRHGRCGQHRRPARGPRRSRSRSVAPRSATGSSSRSPGSKSAGQRPARHRSPRPRDGSRHGARSRPLPMTRRAARPVRMPLRASGRPGSVCRPKRASGSTLVCSRWAPVGTPRTGVAEQAGVQGDHTGAPRSRPIQARSGRCG